MISISNDDQPPDSVRELFGDVIYSYNDAQAIEDGILVPFVMNSKDTGMRITGASYEELKEHYRAKGYESYSETQFYRFFFNEIIALIPTAIREWGRGGILTTNYDFRIEKYNPRKSKQLWYEPNENDAITVLKPEEH